MPGAASRFFSWYFGGTKSDRRMMLLWAISVASTSAAISLILAICTYYCGPVNNEGGGAVMALFMLPQIPVQFLLGFIIIGPTAASIVSRWKVAYKVLAWLAALCINWFIGALLGTVFFWIVFGMLMKR